MKERFDLDSEDCEILLEFEQAPNLQSLADSLGKDISVISRKLKTISNRAPVLEKVNGRWKLSGQGLSLNKWTRDAIFSQKLALGQQRELKIVTTREFATRILVPKIQSLIDQKDLRASIITTDDGIEKYILDGTADFGFDCGRPQDPLIAFKHCCREDFVIVASPKFIKANKVKSYDDVSFAQRLYFKRCENIIYDNSGKRPSYFGLFHDVATLREACLQGAGWATLPYYCVKRELKDKRLQIIKGATLEPEKYSVWWNRERQSIDPWIAKARKWLKAQEKKLCL